MSALIKPITPFHLISALNDDYANKQVELKSVSKGSVGTSIVQLEVAGVVFAVEVGLAVETIPYRKPQALPRSHPWALGLIELRGEVVPIIDIAILNNQVASVVDKSSRLMIVRYEQMVFGLLASNVATVTYVPKIHEGSHDELGV